MNAQTAAANGAALLDAEVPGWPGRIDTTTLHMGMTCSCILGQLFGDYCHGKTALRDKRPGLTVVQHGFDIGPGISMDEQADTYSHLRDAWLYEIAVRMQAPVTEPERAPDEELVQV